MDVQTTKPYWSLALPVLSKVTFGVAVFASTLISASMPTLAPSWSFVGLFFCFFWFRARIDSTFEYMGGAAEKGRLSHTATTILAELVDTNWNVVALVLADQLVRLFTGWLRLVDNAIVGFMLINSPLLLCYLALMLYGTLNVHNQRVVATVGDMVARMAYSFAYFAATVLEAHMPATVTMWVWLLYVMLFGLLQAVVLWDLSLWKPVTAAEEQAAVQALPVVEVAVVIKGAKCNEVHGEKETKRLVEQDWEFLSMIAAFVLADTVASIVKLRWKGAESFFFGAVWTNLLLVGALALTQAMASRKSALLAAPGGLIDRALFAMALFLAKYGSSYLAGFREWQAFWMLIGVVVLNGLVTWVFALWEPSDRGEERLKALYRQTLTTWIMIGLSFTVKMIVDRFATLWRQEDDAFVAVVWIETILLLMIGVVHCTGAWLESDHAGTYLKSLTEKGRSKTEAPCAAAPA